MTGGADTRVIEVSYASYCTTGLTFDGMIVTELISTSITAYL